MIIIGALAVVGLGASAIGNTENNLAEDRAEKTLTQFDSKAALVALGEAQNQEVQFPNDGNQFDVVENTGTLRIEVTNRSTGVTPSWGDDLVNVSLGSVVYEGDETRIAYQGGGVFRNSDNSTVLVSPPEFHYRGGTLTFPIVNISSGSSLGRSATVSNSVVSQAFPHQQNNNKTNPLTGHEVRVIIQSEYYRGWGHYFEDRTDGGVSYDHANQEVTLTLLKQETNRQLSNALSVYGGSGTLRIQSGATVVIESYNSSSVPSTQTTSPSSSGLSGVETSMDVNFNGNSDISGDLTTSGSVSFGGGMSGVGGNLSYGEGSADCSHVGGWCEKNASQSTPPPITNLINDTITSLASDNDNAAEPCLSAAQGLRYGAGPCGGNRITIGAGDYYIDNQDFRVNGNKLILDTTGGDIRIALDNDRQIQINQGNVTVVGDGEVRLYTTKQNQITGNGAKVWNRGWDAHQFWVFCDADCHLDITNRAVFNGVVYAPSGPGGNAGDIEVRQNSEVYGAIVAGGGSNAEIGQNSEIYFDNALKTVQILNQPTIPPITYLHLTTNTIDIESD
jgi:hypothetical protein